MTKLVREHINEEEKPFKYFKGKSKDEVEKALEGMSLSEKFEVALLNNMPLLLKECIDKGIDLNNYTWIYDYVIAHNMIDNLKVLLSNTKNINISSNIIPESINYISDEMLEFLLNNTGLDPTYSSNLAIRRAANFGLYNKIKILMKDPRVDPSANANTAYRLAKEEGHTDIMKLLLQDERVRKMKEFLDNVGQSK